MRSSTGSGEAFTVRDVGSLNGTYVNRERIEESGLSAGDEVQVGKFRLVFLTQPARGGRQRGRAGRGMSAQPARAYYGIGEVLAQLSGEFPDVRISKIRFLEAEGLIEPARSPSGYRRFSRRDVSGCGTS